MAKRSVSKNFDDNYTKGQIFDWMIEHLPLKSSILDGLSRPAKKIRITISFDPDNKMSIIPEGPKIPHHHAKTRG